jgi:hypothetical protein
LVLAWLVAGSRCSSVSHEAVFASAASVRALCKLGSGLTVSGHNRVAVFASVGGSCNLGSSLSVQSFVRIGSSMNAAYGVVSGGRCEVAGAAQQVSVRDSGNIGRIGGSVGLTVRSFARLGSELTVWSSVAGTTRIDEWLSKKENKTDMASSISVSGIST